MAEPITIIFQTFKRTAYALETIAAARELLRYPDLRWYVADDGSPQEHWYAVNRALHDCGAMVIDGHSRRQGYGKNANDAWLAADVYADLTFWLEDDFALAQPLDLYVYAALLLERPDIGMVRLGYINPDYLGPTIEHDGWRYHTLDRTPPDTSRYAFTGHPSLRHRRYREAYGLYPEGLTPGDTELGYAYQYRVGDGPLIVWPADYPTDGYFRHIGEIKTETML